MGEFRQTLTDNPHDRDTSPSPLPMWLQRVLVAGFVALLFVAFAFLFVHRWRRGTAVMGASLLYLAAVRWFVDSRQLGVLSVRSRKFDSWFSGTLGAVMLWLAFSIDSLSA